MNATRACVFVVALASVIDRMVPGVWERRGARMRRGVVVDEARPIWLLSGTIGLVVAQWKGPLQGLAWCVHTIVLK
jgi:hypothetical protein